MVQAYYEHSAEGLELTCLVHKGYIIKAMVKCISKFESI